MGQIVEIDFMYIDLDVCTRCIGSDQNLDEALSEVKAVLEAEGVETVLRKILVDSTEKARALQFLTSPTIRVNGRDIALDLRESRCEACSSNGSVECRVWVYRGKEYTEAPKAMIVDAVLQEVYGRTRQPKGNSVEYLGVPENLKRFFAGKAQHDTNGDSRCCAPAEQLTCCEPSEKAQCCETVPTGQCGCQSSE